MVVYFPQRYNTSLTEEKIPRWGLRSQEQAWIFEQDEEFVEQQEVGWETKHKD